jgi:flagellar basal body P-ring protein FlgI
MCLHFCLMTLPTVMLATPILASIVPDAVADDATHSSVLLHASANVVMGIGLVVGLRGTGAGEVDDALVESSIVGVLRRAGLDLWHDQIKPGSVAVVVITAEVPASPAGGTRVAASVSAIGDAVSLVGGTLLPTPLHDSNGVFYAASQGQISVDSPIGRSHRFEANDRFGRVDGGIVINGRRLQEAAIY